MNSDQVGGIVRTLLGVASGWAIGKGYLDNDTAVAITGGVVTIATAGWSWFSNRSGKTIQ